MNRDQWEFSFPVSMVKKAAINKAEYHESRLEDWQQRLKESEQKIHDQAGVNEIPVTGGNRLEIAVPDDLASEYKTSKKKVEHHDEKMETYDRWVRSLDHLENEGGHTYWFWILTTLSFLVYRPWRLHVILSDPAAVWLR